MQFYQKNGKQLHKRRVNLVLFVLKDNWLIGEQETTREWAIAWNISCLPQIHHHVAYRAPESTSMWRTLLSNLNENQRFLGLLENSYDKLRNKIKSRKDEYGWKIAYIKAKFVQDKYFGIEKKFKNDFSNYTPNHPQGADVMLNFNER